MPKRSFDDNFWGDTFVQGIDKDAKMLFIYLWTNKRCNSAGVYEITTKTISFETGIDSQDLPSLFEILESKIKWLPGENIVWVKNFLKHQPKSPFFLQSVAKCLPEIHANGLVREFLSYYEVLGVSIPYIEGVDMVSIPYTEGLYIEQEQEHIIINEGKHKYGENNNVLLTNDEYMKLKDKFGKLVDEKINDISFYLASKGTKYKSHYLTMLNWARKDEKTLTGPRRNDPRKLPQRYTRPEEL